MTSTERASGRDVVAYLVRNQQVKDLCQQASDSTGDRPRERETKEALAALDRAPRDVLSGTAG